MSVIVAFVDVDTLAVLLLVSVGADAVAVFLNKTGFAVAVEVALCVLACFGRSVAGVCSFVAFVDVFAGSIFIFVSIWTDTLAGFLLITVGTDAVAILFDKSGFAVAIEVTVCVLACFGGSVAGVSVVGTFIDVDTLAGLFLVSVGADAVAIFLNKAGFAVAVEVAVGVLACFGRGIACVCSFATFVDIFTLSIFVFVSVGADAVAVLFDKTGFAVALV